MQFIDLAAQYAAHKPAIDARIQAVLDEGQYIMGPQVGELEEELASYVGVRHAIGCANGTDALHLALMALSVGPGDAVFTTPFTFFATAEVISLVGATPVFVDIEPETYNIDAAALDEAASRTSRRTGLRLKAVIPVDIFGLPANYEALEQVAGSHGLVIIEDAAQGFGGKIGDRRAGSFGQVATTSFFPAKPLGCYGDGGALFTNDDGLAALLRSLRIHGKGLDKYDNIRIGLNSRLDTLQAAILLEKLKAFPRELEQRQRVAERYALRLADAVTIPRTPTGYLSSWAQYTIGVPLGRRDSLVRGLERQGIPSAIYYATPLHLQTAFKNLGHQRGSFPNAEAAADSVLSLPMHPYLNCADIDSIAGALRKAIKETSCAS